MGMDVPGLLEQRTRRDHPFIVWEPFEGLPEVISYGMFYERVRRIAGGLQRAATRAGDCDADPPRKLPRPSWPGTPARGWARLPMTTNARASDDELQYYAEHCGAVGGITQPKFAARVAASCKGLRWLAVTATDSGHAPQQGAPDAASSFAALDAAPVPRRPADPLAPCSVQYTSGTTSRPKAVLWTHANALWGARINAAHEDLRAEDVHLVHLPLFHTNAQAYSVLACLWVGATAVVLPRFSASRFWPVSIARRVTWTSMIPFASRPCSRMRCRPSTITACGARAPARCPRTRTFACRP